MNIPVLTLLKMPEVALCSPWKQHGSVLSRVLSNTLMAWLSCGAGVCRWSLNGTLIDLRTDQRRVLSGGNLIIRDLDQDQDAGTYQCTAHNPHGAILSRRASLKFACKQWNAHPVLPHAHPAPLRSASCRRATLLVVTSLSQREVTGGVIGTPTRTVWGSEGWKNGFLQPPVQV